VATILVVEDDNDAAEVLNHALRKTGHRVMSVPNGREALALLLLGNVDLVITDLRMPMMDGVTLLGVMRSYLRFQAMPVIVFSAFADGRAAERLAALGVADVFLKGSADLADVVRAVERHLAPPAHESSSN
jgi:CheY-like chemotaxis protein